ncbi:MAG: rod shape-determining protein MreC [Methylophilaceae bacterium]|nr:rod shape-determining protein MreC [Methylophilaceae bacterium]
MATLQHQEPPAFFVRGPSPFARLIFFSMLSLALMVVDARLHYLTEVRQGLAALLHPLELLATGPLHLYRQISERMRGIEALIHENRELRERLLRQSVDLQKLASLQHENTHLRRLLEVRVALQQPIRLAEIVRAGRDPFSHRVIVDQGSHQGVLAGQVVVDGEGVIGQVTRVYPFSSEVTLITDRDLAVPVQVERNGLRAIAFGHGRDHTLDLPYLPVNVDIREGDRLVTSGIDGIYPAGLAVATVTSIERDTNSPFARIVCTPVAGTDRNRQVLILTALRLENTWLESEDEHRVPSAQRKGGRRHASR